MAVYSDVYSTAEVFLHSRSGCFCGAFKLFSELFQVLITCLYLTFIRKKQCDNLTSEVT